MKPIKLFLFVLIFSGLSIGLDACGGTDDDQPGKPGSEIVDGRWTEQGNQLIYKVSYNYGYGVSYSATWTLTFEGDSCVKSVCACAFSNSEMANAFYQGWRENGTYPATKSGNTITIDWTAVHRGMSKTELKAAIAAMDGV